MTYEDPREDITVMDPAERAMSDTFFHMRGCAGACMFEVDLSKTMTFLDEQRSGGLPKLTFTHILIKACAEVLRRRPELGYRACGYKLVRPSTVDIGVSVAGARGGLAPVVVIREADAKDMPEIMEELRQEARRARDEEEENLRKLAFFLKFIPFNWLRRWLIRIFFKRHRTVRELTGTFHITNVGPLGIDQAFSPIIMATLMTVGQVKERPMVKDGEVRSVVGSIISIQGDHRIVDGKRAADFMRDLQRVLDAPEKLLLPPPAEGSVEPGAAHAV